MDFGDARRDLQDPGCYVRRREKAVVAGPLAKEPQTRADNGGALKSE
jgi:hypothetical protein